MITDYDFMVTFLLTAILAFSAGWITRSWVARDQEMTRHRMQKSIERARMMHPSRSTGTERGTWTDGN